MPHFTPTERRILEKLSDGLPHHRDVLMALLNDDMTSRSTLGMHIFRIRKKLLPIGEYIVTEIPNGQTPHYRHVRLLASAYR